MAKLKDLFRMGPTGPETPDDDGILDSDITQDEHKHDLELDKSVLDVDAAREKKLQKEAERSVVTSAEDSLKRLHIIQMGRCPACGDHLRKHLFASICQACGWHTYDVPRRGKVRVHLRDRAQPIEGDRCYAIKHGGFLVVQNELVVARVSREAVSWIEYDWPKEEVDQRHLEVVEHMEVRCGWCAEMADPEKEGFHLVHVALGASQERYCFCSDDCFEAFRKMYPSRVDRDCYERNCADCDLCVRRYDDEAEGIRVLAKDFLLFRRRSVPETDDDTPED